MAKSERDTNLPGLVALHICLLIEAALGAADTGNETFSPHLVRKLRRCLNQLAEADDD